MAKKSRRLSKNLLTYFGLSLAAVTFTVGVVLILSEMIIENRNPYSAVVTYMVVPGVLSIAVFISLLGMFLEWRRQKKKGGEKLFPVVDLNKPKTLRKLFVVLIGLVTFGTISAVATYKGFVYTESTEFCGLTCHNVMGPEFTAYQTSPHARVACVSCHIGEGAEWYVRAKVSGLRQVFRTIMGSYEMPIQTPIENLRPARETCEHCHWPDVFAGSVERIQWHYWYDEENTPSVYHMLMKVGGTNPASGRAEGIHWHTSQAETVRYWPRDRQRLDIPWVEVEHEDGTTTVYRAEDGPTERPPEAEIRDMDCIDCHNRPSHIYRAPDMMVNLSLLAGRLDTDMPSMKANSIEVLTGDYDSMESARRGIADGIRAAYADEGIAAERVDAAITELTAIYEATNFPDHGVNWQTYPNHIGHRNFPGCFRCHNDEHATETGETISMECANCHDFVYQASGDAVNNPVVYQSGPWEHPDGWPDAYEYGLCTDCHGVEMPEEEGEGEEE